MEPWEVIKSEQLKRQALRLSQIELMIESGGVEYQQSYNTLEKMMLENSTLQMMFARQMLEKTLDCRQIEMSDIEKTVYTRSIRKLHTMQVNGFTAHKESMKTRVMT